MKNKIINPFVTGGYMSPDYFCDRQNETARLMQAISSRRNVTLISLRRMGKTGLLKHVRYLLGETKKSVAVVYVDLMPTMNGNEMLNTISSAVINLRKEEKNFFEKVLTILASLRPKLTYDNLTGQPSLELKVESSSDIQFGFEQLLRFIPEIKRDIVFMFDEFQQISNYPEKNIEHLLRTIIQSYPTIPFIFSGSSKHMLESMFLSSGKPFYQSSELMYLEKIAGEDYSNFITELFSSGGKMIKDDAVSRIFKWTRLHTYYVQYVCSLLYESGNKQIDNDLINRVLHQVLDGFEPLFASYRNLIPSHQFKLLQAIAVEDGISKPTSGAFIKDHDLTTASSVTTSLKALEEKEMIVREGDRWLVYDVFFTRWLEYHYRK
jgi:uncharacterized protein